MIKTAVLKNELTIRALKVLLAIVALAASAQISIPFKPVPVTMHTAIVMVIGLTYSPRLAFFSTALYICIGALGAPVFQSFQSGIDGGPTFGYLIAFIPSAVTMACIRQSFGDSLIKTFIYSVIGTAIIFIFGISWLCNFLDFKTALYDGCFIFIPTGILKILFVTATISYIRKS